MLIFFDDILVYRENVEAHVEHMKLVMKKLEEHTLFANKKSAILVKNKVAYLGHVSGRCSGGYGED